MRCSMRKIKVAILHNIIAPYRIPLFNKIAMKRGMDLNVFFLSETAGNRRWDTDMYKKDMQFTYKVLPGFTIPFSFRETVEYIINPTIFWHLWKGKYDVVITSGWLDFACQMTFFLHRIFKYR